MPQSYTVFWYRRDLRLDDNAGLYHALKSKDSILPIFIFDRDILDHLKDRDDARVSFIFDTVKALQEDWGTKNIPLLIFHDRPIEIFKKLCDKIAIKTVIANHDYEPKAVRRDSEISQFLQSKNIEFKTFKDQCVFEKAEVTKDDGLPYTVFTPYKRKWLAALEPFYIKPYPSRRYFERLKKASYPIEKSLLKPITLNDLGFQCSLLPIPKRTIALSIVKKYDQTRNTPSIDGTTRLGLHLRFGTLSIRKCVEIARKTNETWLSELIWRDFFMQILWHHPRVENESFRQEFNQIKWRNNKSEFARWCQGQTGYALVDAGMRELNSTGHMHNRVRMVVASFLTKHLLIDWRWGERYFARRLLDFDLSANNGNWQWAAGTGCDAAPYFRIFNPIEQQKKFDPNFEYIQKWVPEWQSAEYQDLNIVDHRHARERALAAYGDAKKNKT